MCLLGRLKILFIVSIIFSVVALNGLDNVQAGLRQAWTGKSAQTLTSSAVESATGSYIAGEIVDAGIGMISPGGVRKIADLFKKTCFTAGTQIVVGANYNGEGSNIEYVIVNIEDIKVGDFVYSYDTITGEVSQKEVTDTFVRTSDHINYLTIIDENGNEQIIETTDLHPFWIVTDNPDLSRAAQEVVDENVSILYHENIGVTEHGYWVEAKDLHEGDIFLGANGELSTLVSTERVEFPEGITVYNFTVDGNHDYFVIAKTDAFGQTCILVHNADILDYKNIPVYRGGTSLEPRLKIDIKVDKDGLIPAGRGISVNTSTQGLDKFGGAFRIKSIPDELEIVRHGSDKGHYEIAPKIPMTVEQYKELLKKVVLDAN